MPRRRRNPVAPEKQELFAVSFSLSRFSQRRSTKWPDPHIPLVHDRVTKSRYGQRPLCGAFVICAKCMPVFYAPKSRNIVEIVEKEQRPLRDEYDREGYLWNCGWHCSFTLRWARS